MFLPPIDVAVVIRDVNASNEAVEDQCLRTRQAAALPHMRRLLYLLTARYPSATVTINGYTDSLPVPGGNLRLSRLRAQEVEDWLIAHGIAAGRLQAFGYGDTDPAAPNTSRG